MQKCYRDKVAQIFHGLPYGSEIFHGVAIARNRQLRIQRTDMFGSILTLSLQLQLTRRLFLLVMVYSVQDIIPYFSNYYFLNIVRMQTLIHLTKRASRKGMK